METENMSTTTTSPIQASHTHKRSGLKGKLFGGVKVRRARSFSGQEKHKTIPVKDTKEDTATLSDTEGYGKSRRPRRRTTGGSEIADDVTKAKMSGYSSEPESPHSGTLNRQQIIAMVKQRFGLNASGNPARANVTIQEERGPPSPSSPKQIRYDRLLEQPGTYPTLPRKEEAPHPVNTPGVIYLQLGEEIRRAMIPTNMNKVEQVHSLFENTFTEKYKKENNNNRKTIYIKDPSCGIFYELEDVGDLSNKSHLKILDSAPKPVKNGPVSMPATNTSVTYNSSASPVQIPSQKQYITSTPLPDHSHVRPTDPLQGSQGNFQWKTRVTEMRSIDGKTHSVTRTAVSQGNLMDKKKVPLPGLGAQLTHEKRRASKDQAVEDQLDNLTSMLQDALTKTESLDSLPVRNESASSSQSSMADQGHPEGNGLQHAVGIIRSSYRSRLRSDSGAESMSDTPPTPPEVKPKPVHSLPTPPPRASSKNVSRETSIKYSQTLQREIPKRNLNQQQYGTLPLPSSSATKQNVREIRSEFSPMSTTRTGDLSTLSRASPVHVKYEGNANVVDKTKLRSKASELKSDIQIMKAQLGQLKHIHGYQAKSFEEMMNNAKQQILLSMNKLCTAVEDTPKRTARNNLHADEMKYIKAKNDINRKISELESEVEMVRLDVIQKRSLSSSMEIESMNSQLAVISRQIADLRSHFTEIHDSMKLVMAEELDVIVQGDKFLKEEPSKLENLVSRCKHVTGTLFTLQKLMSAQEQMKSESQISFSSLDEVDKDLIDSIRSSHLKRTPSDVHEDSRIKNRPRVRFCDEIK